jgi:F0F1-type ATP synthase delta subunit
MQVTPKQYARAWYKLVSKDKSKVKTMSKKLLTHLYKAGKLSWISEIVRLYEDIEHANQGIEHVVVTSSHEITQTEAINLAQELLNTQELDVSQKTNPDIIAGIQVETKNKRWDLSLSNQLNQLTKHLAI